MTQLEAGSDVDVEGALSQTASVVRRRMLDLVPDAEPHDHLWRLVREYPARPGKALRPTLCLAACRAFGGDERVAMPVAVGMELMHNAFLVHDDIADGSLQRRGRPTLSAEHGVGLALNAGDALMVLAFREIRRHLATVDPEVSEQVFEELDSMSLRTLEGQATELGWQREPSARPSAEDYLQLILHKTCWYTTIFPLRVGALLGHADPDSVRAMVRFGFHLGAAFQIQDDVLNLTGDAALYGKEIGGDLWEGKRTLMLVHLATEAAGRDAAVVDEYLHADRDSRDENLVAEIRGLMARYGSVEYALEYAKGIAAVASDAFEEAFAAAHDSDDRRLIRGIIPYMLQRRL